MFLKFIFFVLCVIGTFNSSLYAQVFLEQAKVSLDVSAGDHRSGFFLIHNTASFPITLKVYWEDFQYKAPYDGSKDFLPSGTIPLSAGKWIIFSPQMISLPAFGQQRIDYTVTVPDQMNEGRYGVLFFENGSSGKMSGTGVSIVTRTGCLFFIEPKDKNKKALIKDISFKANKLSFNMFNQGNVVLIPHVTYYIMQDSGIVNSRGDLKKLYLPSGATGSLEIDLKKKLNAGQYTLVINADLDGGDVVDKEIGLTVDAIGQVSIKNTQDSI